MAVWTVTGPVTEDRLGLTLMHEHVMVGFIKDGLCGPQCYDAEDVVRVMEPYLRRLREAGCDTFVDCTPEFLGRDPEILAELSRRTGLLIITNTGFYQTPFLAPFVYDAAEEELSALWIEEAQSGIEETGIRPGMIKIALTARDEPISPVQGRILRAAIETSRRTGLTIGAHTVGATAAAEAVRTIREAGLKPERWIWIHAWSEPEDRKLLEVAKSGCWIEIDNLTPENTDETLKRIGRLLDGGLSPERLLLSQDTGWYHIGQHHGGEVQPYERILTHFLPAARKAGLYEEAYAALTRNAAAALGGLYG